jgi:hypothetical protein
MKKKEVQLIPALKAVSKKIDTASRLDILEVLLQEGRETLVQSLEPAQRRFEAAHDVLSDIEDDIREEAIAQFRSDHLPVLEKFLKGQVEVYTVAPVGEKIDLQVVGDNGELIYSFDVSANLPFLWADYQNADKELESASKLLDFARNRLKNYERDCPKAETKLLKQMLESSQEGKDLLDKLRREIVYPMLEMKE